MVQNSLLLSGAKGDKQEVSDSTQHDLTKQSLKELALLSRKIDDLAYVTEQASRNN